MPGRCRDDFGRWRGGLQECRIQIEGQSGWLCRQLVVVQTSDQVLSLRFLKNREDRQGNQQLQLIGTMPAGEGLDCNPNGCSLTPRLQLMVTGLATMQFDGRGLARTTPTGAVAKGQCQWRQRQLRCQFQVRQGAKGTIQASL
ncbi:MAG: hypothetical protein ACKOCM_09230 [Cyanobacteriota bacterium]